MTYKMGKERRDERRTTGQDVVQDHRGEANRRKFRYGIKYVTVGSLVKLEDWLDKYCVDQCNIILIGMDDKLEKKEVQIMFITKADKDKFIEEYHKPRGP